ncbi:MAG: TIGR02530 family flagellar biosynthesis protein [Lachnospira sp.]
MNNINTNFTSIEQMTDIIGQNNSKNYTGKVYDGPSFADIFNQKRTIEEVISDSKRTEGVNFSKHAGLRLEERDIQLSQEQLSRLESATDKAVSKGIKEALVIVDDLAFIVNTKNRTVITAMDQNANEDNIYTNIDGAVVI